MDDGPASPAEIVLSKNMQLLSPKIPSKVEPTLEQRGLQFFIEQYLMKTPDAPSADRHLAVYSGSTQAMQTVMMAVGLAGLSHKRGDKAMNLIARQKYTAALKQTGQLIATGPSDVISVMGPLRAVVTLAMFEVVQGKGSKLSTGTANIHILGAIALLRNVVPHSQYPVFGARAILQLMYSLVGVQSGGKMLGSFSWPLKKKTLMAIIVDPFSSDRHAAATAVLRGACHVQAVYTTTRARHVRFSCGHRQLPRIAHSLEKLLALRRKSGHGTYTSGVIANGQHHGWS